MPSRRQLLQWATASALLGGHRGAAPATKTANIEHHRVTALTATLVETPRAQCLEACVDRIRRGATQAELLVALTMAGVNHVEPYPTVGFKYHTVMMLSALHSALRHSPLHQRWPGLLWAVDIFKGAQARDTFNGDWQLQPAKAPSASREQATRVFRHAMDTWDIEAADTAIVQLARTAPLDSIFALLFYYGARDFRDIGHKAITVSNSHRLLQWFDRRYAEPLLRSTVYALLNHSGEPNPATNDLDADRPWRFSADQIGRFPEHWQQGKAASGATAQLLAALRREPYTEVAALAVELLRDGRHPQVLWDAVFLGAGELIMRTSGIVSVHANTSVNALHYAYRQVGQDSLRRRLLLQSLAFVVLFRDLLGRTTRQTAIDTLPPLSTSAKGDQRYEEIFEDIGGNRLIAARKVLHLLASGDHSSALMALGRRYTIDKTTGYHDYKFTEAAFENAGYISVDQQARYLSASVFYLNGAQDKNNLVVEQAKSML